MPDILNILLIDRTASLAGASANIIWASEHYVEYGAKNYAAKGQITSKLISGEMRQLIMPRALKALELQKIRTKSQAEVFTPVDIVKKQNDVVEADYANDDLEHYVKRKWLEITCGEAPYMATRYDMQTGAIIPISMRVGFVDRKLSRINAEVNDEDEWLRLAAEAYRSSYGFEWSGDSLLLARENLLYTFCDYYAAKWGAEPPLNLLEEIAVIISFNLFQMDGLKGILPLSDSHELIGYGQLTLLDTADDLPSLSGGRAQIMDWDANKMVLFAEEARFDVVVGNPPYQESAKGESTKDTPIYPFFYDLAKAVSSSYCLISPARFLFNAGSTAKSWNQSMLHDRHLRVVHYQQSSASIFPNTDIKGGVAILYRNAHKDFGEIGTFSVYEELTSILKKVTHLTGSTLDEIVSNRGQYRYSDAIYKDYPVEMKAISDRRIASNAFRKLPDLFTDRQPDDGAQYIQIFGRLNNDRVFRWFKRDYLTADKTLSKYKIILPKANGTGKLGEALSTPLILPPGTGFTETFIAIGAFDHEEEAQNALKYIKSKFARIMLGVLKITQDNTSTKWRKVPLQDFTTNSDIDWSASIAAIDQQLYAKYGLDKREITFIETKAKSMV
ncbi:Eco57I restriction-modification methylase domain-containing protein [Cardiobacteriaceae bacterium TAE3-ERU3]|nr:Eco57I restriction-modification methylase domain-containing protein [Cardiobacteriaceae bacterium TAE3-ERU3]